MFIALAGIQDITVHVPFRGGGPAMTATIAGDTQFFFSPIAGMVPFVEAGSVRALAVSGEHALAGAAERADHRRGRHAALQGGGLVRPDGAGRHAAGDRRKAQRCGRRGGGAPEVIAALRAQGIEPSRQPAAEFARLRPRAARAAPAARQGRRSQDQRIVLDDQGVKRGEEIRGEEAEQGHHAATTPTSSTR